MHLRRNQEHDSVESRDLLARLSDEQRQAVKDAESSILQAIEGNKSHGEAFLEALRATPEQIQAQSAQTEDPMSKGSESQLKRNLKYEKAAGDAILKSLAFSEIQDRRNAIKRAHEVTFEWVFAERSILVDWLQSSRPLFWINGKAGSGKSTLMKFLTSRQQTTRLLEKWAGGRFLHVIEFYFWYLGTAMQKSQQGLLRGVLYQVLSQARDLIQTACPEQWKSVYENIKPSGKNRFEKEGLIYDPWSDEELVASIERLARFTSDHRFCFFIDGLDEYYADHSQLVKLIQKLSENPEFKFCVSSRPWNVFVNAFTSPDGDISPDSLVLEELTRPDIERYVHAELRDSVHEQPEMQALVSEVSIKAQGVFLWVFLVVRSLQEGVVEGDTVSILRQRLEELPSDLVEYFELIFSRVAPVYKKWTASALQLALFAARREKKTSSQIEHATNHARSFISYWLLQNRLEDPDFAIAKPLFDVDPHGCINMVQSTRKFISACCKDLLYVPKPPPAKGSDEQTYITQYKVEFLHRTVYEFLDAGEMRERIQSRSIRHMYHSNFDTLLALARLKVVPSKSKGRCRYLNEVLADFANPGLTYHDRLARSVYAELDKVSAYYMRMCDCLEHDWQPLYAALLELVKHRCFDFAVEVLPRCPGVIEKDFSAAGRERLLRYALGMHTAWESFNLDQANMDLVWKYVSHVRMDGSYSPDGVKIWPWFVGAWKEQSQDQHLDAEKLYALAKLFIRRGADVNGRLGPPNDHVSIGKTLAELVPKQYQLELHQMIVDKVRSEHDSEAYFRRTGFRI